VRERIDARAGLNDVIRVQAPTRGSEGEDANAHSLSSRTVLLLVCCAVGAYIWFAVRLYLANRLAAHHDPISLRRAIKLQPSDANNYDLLGQYLIWEAQDPRGAATQFQEGARLNPYASSYWGHLAQAESNLGNDSEQAAAIRKAIAVDPTTPDLAWSAANYFLIQGDTGEALDQFAVVIRSDPAMAEAALERSWRAVEQVDAIEQRLPPDPGVYLSFLKILVAKRQWTAAQQIWTSMLKLNQHFDPRSSLFYVDGLLAKPDIPGAQRVWQQIIERSPELKPYVTPGNLVVNPGFDHEFLNGGFDWHYSYQNGVSMVLDPTQTHEGSEALLITYSGADNQDAGISEPIPVTPGVAYIASAWVRSEELDTANGPQLAVFDGYHKQALTQSEETLGSTGWHRVQATFTAPNETNLVFIRISREPASTRIQGKLWIDDVQLVQNIGQTD
jgi:cytochrome c-type biogenesis protein CcmH/NrfG